MNIALGSAGLSMGDVRYIIGTGYGRNKISFANRVESRSPATEGAWHRMPAVRTVIDIAARTRRQSSSTTAGTCPVCVQRQVRLRTGRFLEIMADALEVKLQDMGR